MTTAKELLGQIGKGLKLARNSRGKSIKGHCKTTNQSESNYTNYEKGVRPMSLAMLVKLVDEHNCNVVINFVPKVQGGWK